MYCGLERNNGSVSDRERHPGKWRAFLKLPQVVRKAFCQWVNPSPGDLRSNIGSGPGPENSPKSSAQNPRLVSNWGQAKKTVGEVFEYTDDLEEALKVDKSWLPTYASSNKNVLTSIHLATYEALWVGISHTWTDRAGNAQEATYLCLHWASVTVDEVHKVRAKKNPLMTDALMQIKSSFHNTADRQPPRFPR